MPAFNAESTIAESINSVLLQTFQNWELIIINDGSTDKTHDIAEGFACLDNRIRILDLPQNTGVSNARNQGVLSASGKYLAFLDSDDLWESQKLYKQYNIHKSDRNCLISHTDYSIFIGKSKIRTPLKFFFSLFSKKSGDIFHLLLYFNSVGVLTVMIEKGLFFEFNGFDQVQWGMEDHDLWLRISHAGHQFSFVDEELSSYRLNQNGMMNSIGKYKRTYKRFINKHQDLMSRYNKINLARSYYFRHFGIHYFRNNNYKLALLYLGKAITNSSNIYLQLITLPYCIISFLKYRKTQIRFI